MRRDQYLIKQAYRKPIIPHKLSNRGFTPLSLDDTSTYSHGTLTVSGISLMDPKCVAALLQNYSRLKQDSCDRFESDTYYLMQALEQITDSALREYPIFQTVLVLKIDGVSNADIRTALKEQHDVLYTPEYISALWTKKIPSLIAEEAQRDFIIWQTARRKLPSKTCSRCGHTLPKHTLFYTVNNSSKDGWYSMCKRCRRAH